MKIMFVCHGNICRSPMAEAILRDMAKKRGVSLTVASSATSDEEIRSGVGNPVYPPAREELAAHGLSLPGKHSVQLKKSEYGDWDLFIGMDSANIRNMHRIFGGDLDGKIRRMLPDRDVADPWYSGKFDVAFRDIYEGCEALIREMCDI